MISDHSNRRLRILTAANLAFLLVLCMAEQAIAERHWLTTLITYSPQHWAGVPAVILLIWSLVRRSWKPIGLNLLALGIFVTGPLGLCGGPGIPRSLPDHEVVRVMTWNIHHASRGVDGVMQVVEAERPDIVCFQEANDGYWKSDVLPELRKEFAGWRCSRFREVATFSRHPIVMERVHRLMPETGRVVLETVIDADGEQLTIYNTHLNVAVEGRSLKRSVLRGMPAYLRHTAEVRLDQVRDLKQTVAAAKGTAVIAGDFNTPPRGWSYRRIAGRYQDAFKQGGSGFGYTYPARCPLMRIDYIFADDKASVRRCYVSNAGASDHRPVIADLVIQRKERQTR